MGYVKGRILYELFRLIAKGFYYFFAGIVWFMYYCIFYAGMALYLLCKFTVIGIKELFLISKKTLIRLKNRKEEV